MLRMYNKELPYLIWSLVDWLEYDLDENMKLYKITN